MGDLPDAGYSRTWRRGKNQYARNAGDKLEVAYGKRRVYRRVSEENKTPDRGVREIITLALVVIGEDYKPYEKEIAW